MMTILEELVISQHNLLITSDTIERVLEDMQRGLVIIKQEQARIEKMYRDLEPMIDKPEGRDESA